MAGIVSGLEVARAQCESKQRLFRFIIFDCWKQRLLNTLLRLDGSGFDWPEGLGYNEKPGHSKSCHVAAGQLQVAACLDVILPLGTMLNDGFMRRVSAALALSIRIMSSKKSADCAISVATPSPATSVATSVDAIPVPAGSGAAQNWLKWPKKK